MLLKRAEYHHLQGCVPRFKMQNWLQVSVLFLDPGKYSFLSLVDVRQPSIRAKLNAIFEASIFSYTLEQDKLYAKALLYYPIHVQYCIQHLPFC
jgi:hypothetical protein